MSTVKDLTKKQLIHPPSFLPEAVQYEVIMGSFAYGVNSDSSDVDLYGFCIPDKRMIFPHLDGEIEGFGQPRKRFEQFQQHGIIDQGALGGAGREYDITIYSIVKYFQLLMENNPNMVDTLYVPINCIVWSTPIGQMVRENRSIFLSKACWHKFKGYAYSQVNKMKIKEANPDSKRYESYSKHGYDVKFAYHVVRLIDEVEQILTLGDMDLMRAREQMKSVRRGEWTIEQIEDYFTRKERDLEALYQASTLPHVPNEEKIKHLLLNCLEQHFGDLSNAVQIVNPAIKALRQIEETLQAARISGVMD
jgi:predicted nucleotidyltransferase